MSVPIGIIIMWSGNAAGIPTGWNLCNGTNGTPDLRGKFVYAADVDGHVGATGGTETHLHSCPDTAYSDASHNHSVSGTTSSNSATEGGATGISTTLASASHTHPFSFNTNAATSSHKHSVPDTGEKSTLPAYVLLYYIMKVS